MRKPEKVRFELRTNQNLSMVAYVHSVVLLL